MVIADLSVGDRFVKILGKILILSALYSVLFSPAYANICNGLENPPSGKADNFNINQHLNRFRKLKAATEFLPPPARLQVRAAHMANSFYTGHKYDLKNSTQYKSSAEFGNWFYGAAAKALGFTEQEALKAGAIIQQVQNYRNDEHENFGNLEELGKGLYISLKGIDGQGDNPDDPPVISGGYSYAKNIYLRDNDADKNSNSCNSENIDDLFLDFEIDLSQLPNTTIGLGISWSGGNSLSVYFGIPSGFVTKTDLNDDYEPVKEKNQQ